MASVCIYLNGRPVAMDVPLVEGADQWLEETVEDRGDLKVQVAILSERDRTILIGQCALWRQTLISKYDPDETIPGPKSER